MKPVKIGEVRVSSIVERDGPWRAPNTMFPGTTAGHIEKFRDTFQFSFLAP
ncbi:MAG: hypothetical protein ACKVQU_28800 [Burkholderiales bacterium]